MGARRVQGNGWRGAVGTRLGRYHGDSQKVKSRPPACPPGWEEKKTEDSGGSDWG